MGYSSDYGHYTLILRSYLDCRQVSGHQIGLQARFPRLESCPLENNLEMLVCLLELHLDYMMESN